jgi:hypothetical protein
MAKTKKVKSCDELCPGDWVTATVPDPCPDNDGTPVQVPAVYVGPDAGGKAKVAFSHLHVACVDPCDLTRDC